VPAIKKSRCHSSQITDSQTLGVWLNGYVNGERGKKLIDPLSPGHISLGHYCECHMDALLLDAARNVFGAEWGPR
jgi:hypothetical protein